MKKINNFKKVALWLGPLEVVVSDGYYQVEIFKRKKDGNCVDDSQSNTHRSLKKFYPKNINELLQLEEEIIRICKDNNARAYIYPSPISQSRMYNSLMLDVVNRVVTKNYGKPVENLAPSLASKNLEVKYFMFDVDSKDDAIVKKVKQIAKDNSVHYQVIPTKNGCHILCLPFNYTTVELPDNVELKQRCPTLLYYEEK